LVGALFPEVLAEDIIVPLGGFRVLRTSMTLGSLPEGYGVETYLNIQVALSGGRIASCPVGWFRGNLRDYANIPRIASDVAATVLDVAEQHGRLDPAMRAAWEDWVLEAVDLLGRQPPAGADDAAYLDELAMVSARPVPVSR